MKPAGLHLGSPKEAEGVYTGRTCAGLAAARAQLAGASMALAGASIARAHAVLAPLFGARK